nr:hypothetical protein [Candidatus Sigynarchaeum springense]
MKSRRSMSKDSMAIEITSMQQGKKTRLTVKARFDPSTMDAVVERSVAESICDVVGMDPFPAPIPGKHVMSDASCLVDVNFSGCRVPRMAFVVPDGTLKGAPVMIGTEGLDEHGITVDSTSKKIVAKRCDERIWIE